MKGEVFDLALIQNKGNLPGMTCVPRLDIIGAALADTSRTRMLCTLMDGRAFTNKELACAANISAQTASAHLKQLEHAGLTLSERSGRWVYHRIANADVASALEGMANLTPTEHLSRNVRANADTRHARSCYNHLAGRLGVRMAQSMIARDILRLSDGNICTGAQYQSFVDETGIAPPHSSAGRPVAKLCLDWTERQHHISGPLATAILTRSLQAGWLERRTGNRALFITDTGASAFEQWFGLTAQDVAPVVD